MTTAPRLFVQEAATLAPRKSDGTYPVVLLTEGEGSSGRYSADLISRSESVFAGVPAFLNHPIDPSKPHMRDVNSIAGRYGDVRVGEDKGKRALVSDFKPRREYAEFVEEFKDVLALSVYCKAKGEVMEDGRLDVQELDGSDPYRSVDIVVAAGRGGRFRQAEENLRAIESSLGLPASQPGVTSAPGSQKEGNMEKEVLEAVVKAVIAEALAPVTSFIAEQKAAADAAVVAAEAKATAAEQDKAGAIEAYAVAASAVAEAALLPSQSVTILEAAKRGEDVAPLIEGAKKVVEEAKQAIGSKTPGYVIESASTDAHDFTIPRLSGV